MIAWFLSSKVGRWLALGLTAVAAFFADRAIRDGRVKRDTIDKVKADTDAARLDQIRKDKANDDEIDALDDNDLRVRGSKWVRDPDRDD